MAYKYVNSKDNHEDLASGRVLYNVPGAPAFPVRLAVELFRRALERLATKTGGSMVSLYDPCCGSGYLLTVLGILHGEHLERLVGSDPDGKLLDVARKNLSLLGDAGLARRMAELGDLYRRFGKASHAGALESAQRIRERILRRGRDIPVHLFQADAAKARTPDEMFPAVDLVMADIPYGGVTSWRGAAAAAADPAALLLEHLLPVLKPVSLVVVVADKETRIEHAAYRRVARLKAGKRQAFFLEPIGGTDAWGAKAD